MGTFKMKKIFCCVVLLLSGSVMAETLVIRGSDTLGDKMVPALAEAYKQAGNATEFDIVAEGSSAAFKGLQAGASIGLSSRPIKDSERQSLSDAGLTVKEHVAGIDMIAIVVNEANPATDLPIDAVEKVFASEVTTWKTLPGTPAVTPFTRNESSGTFKVFQSVAMKGKDYGKTTVKCEGNSQIVEKVAGNQGAIGYVGLSYKNAPGVKTVKINGIAAEPKNSATYPLSRKLYYYTIDGKSSPEALAFIKWAMTAPEAAKIIEEVGFIAP